MEVAAQDHQKTIRRIAALLVALAALAERAGGRSPPVRFLVLSILFFAETVARGFVVGAAPGTWPCLGDPSEIPSGPMDAAQLARRFRALAAALGALLPPACRFGGRNAGSGRAPCRRAPNPHRLVTKPAGGAPRPADTS
ncbi:MAG: hypothetical protein Q8Q62_18640 [Mesorhizobium sp.]|nr:hypothetical protein [Mesorhizobium sp.]